MKDSVRGVFEVAAAMALAAAVLAVAGCGRSNKTAEIAQDSMLVKDADIATVHKVDTAAAGRTLVRDRGSVADAPSLTTGAPVKRATTAGGTSAGGPPPPPKKVYPSPVLPGRDSTAEPIPPARIDPMIAPPTRHPTPTTQSVSPSPPRVIQPPTPTPPPPKTDSSSRGVVPAI